MLSYIFLIIIICFRLGAKTVRSYNGYEQFL